MDTNTPQIPPAETSIELRLTASECEELGQIIDLAVKAGGIRVANSGLKYFQRIHAALNRAIVPANKLPQPPRIQKP